MRTILITGAAGALGQLLRKALKDWDRNVRLTDLCDLGKPANNEEIVLSDLADLDSVTEMIDGVDEIVHLGGKSVEGSFEEILNSNIRGTYNIFEASRRHGGKRILFASSNHAVGFHPRESKLDGNSIQKPDSLYGVSKCFGEILARYYFDKFAVESVSVRIGSCLPEPKDRRMLTTWLSPDDFVRLTKRVFEAERVGALIMYGVSDNQEQWWDNSHASSLGWSPKDNSEPFRSMIEENVPRSEWDDDDIQYQGGTFAKAGHFEDL